MTSIYLLILAMCLSPLALKQMKLPPSDLHGFIRLKQMPIPDANHAVVEDIKVRDYLLNLGHPDGGSKAVWFHSLGYNRDDWHYLSADLLSIGVACDGFDTEQTSFGIKYKAQGLLGRPNYRKGMVLTVWIVEDGEPPRLVTAYPGPK